MRFCCEFYPGGFWVSAFGFAITIIDRRRHQPLFSERNGMRVGFMIGAWRVNFFRRRTK
jgi:hypothetical protein